MAFIKIEKTDEEIDDVVKAQARVRARMGVSALVLLVIFYLCNGSWRAPYINSTELVGLGYVAYNISTPFLASRLWPFNARQLVYVTAVLDPLMLSAALAELGPAGQLIFFFYLFTIIGFGLRLGTTPMWLCQGSAVVGFMLVTAFAPNWKGDLLMAMADLVLLVVVPAYATVLVKTLHSALALAKRESQAKSQLLAHVSHELRTPLTGIVSSAQLIKEDANDFGIGRRADTILSLANELMVEISDLLDSAKYEASALILEMAPFDLRQTMDQVHLALGPTAAIKDIQFSTSVDPLIVDMVEGDQHYLFRILANLGANAVKFTDRGCVELQVRLLDEAPGAYHLAFICRDTGIGIPREWQDKIFTAFVQAPGGNKGRTAGTGLGMSISSQLVGLMGGTLTVESEEGKGSLFQFSLRLPRLSKSLQPSAIESLADIVYGKRIFLAEDNATVRNLLKEILERDKHIVEVACSGNEAIHKLNHQQFDMLLLDYNLGDLEGIAVLAAYRLTGAKTSPAYILTADATEATAEKVRRSGALGILHKPISREQLRKAIARALRDPSPSSASSNVAGHDDLTLGIPQSTALLEPDAIARLTEISPDNEFLTEVIASAIADSEQLYEKLSNAMGALDVALVHEHAHTLRGLCLSVGATHLTTLADTLIRAAATKPMRDAPHRPHCASHQRHSGDADLPCIAQGRDHLIFGRPAS
jgi:two-component system sensor histidine kinase RpfC